MSDDFKRMCSSANLKRAYRWLQSNPDARYKSYFRDAYNAYASTSQRNLVRLGRELERGAYSPSHSTKVFLAKPSGLLRTYTLLSVDDQIVYQACVNIVADKLKPKVGSRYNKSIFGNLYAGKSSQFFYLKWQDGYKNFGKTLTNYVESGHHFVAHFDLTAFYDSIDHQVLSYFLTEIEIDKDLIDFLIAGLRTWSSSTWPQQHLPIYIGHGIPQGPLSSGLLAEVILKYIDDKGTRTGAKYLRYVDDIKIFAKSIPQLRQRLVALDLASKDIGLFPQSSKVNISEVKDPRLEIKSVSNPPEPALRKGINQKRLRQRILELTRRAKVQDSTRFKYLLAQAEPTSTLNIRIMQILRAQPAFSVPVANYLRRYSKLPANLARDICCYLREQQIYHAVVADILFATLDNMPEQYRRECADICYSRFNTAGRKIPPPQATLKAALWAWLLSEQKITFRELEKALSLESNPWIVKEIVMRIDIKVFGTPSVQSLLEKVIQSSHTDAARCAAQRIASLDLTIKLPLQKISHAARPILFAAGKIRQIGKPQSLIHIVLSYVLNLNFPTFNWSKFLGTNHRQAELLAFNVKGHFESSIDACILALDSLCDHIFDEVYNRIKPNKTRPTYGAALSDPTCLKLLPQVCLGFKALHNLRIQSSTAHPKQSKTGQPSRRLKHYDFRQVTPSVQSALLEIIKVYGP